MNIFNSQSILWKDGRNYQILFLSTFLIYGIWALEWDIDIPKYLTIFISCITTQLICCTLFKVPYSSSKSAIITSLGLSILLKANSPWTLVFASVVAIGSKFFIRYRNKHFFNPANIGIVAAIVLTGDAWISPGQWGSSASLLFLVGALGTMVVFRVSRFDISIAFIVTLFILDYIRLILYQGWEMDVLMLKYTNGSVLLFTFFMISDPVTTPNAFKARILWAAGVAGLTFYLTSYMQVHTAPVWALFIVSPLTVIFDLIFKGKKFDWVAQPVKNN